MKTVSPGTGRAEVFREDKGEESRVAILIQQPAGRLDQLVKVFVRHGSRDLGV